LKKGRFTEGNGDAGSTHSGRADQARVFKPRRS
jgi:hypothetical protein